MSTYYLQTDCCEGYIPADSTLLLILLIFLLILHWSQIGSHFLTWLSSLTGTLVPSAVVLFHLLVCLFQPYAWQNGVSSSQHWAPAPTIINHRSVLQPSWPYRYLSNSSLLPIAEENAVHTFLYLSNKSQPPSGEWNQTQDVNKG